MASTTDRSSESRIRQRRARQLQPYRKRKPLRQQLSQSNRSRSVAEGLQSIFRMLNANSSEKEILAFVAQQTIVFCGALAAAVYRFDEEAHLFVLLAGSTLPVELAHFESADLSILPSSRIGTYQVFLCTDLRAYLAANTPSAFSDFGQHEWLKTTQSHFTGLLAMPLIVRVKMYGVLMLFYNTFQARFVEQANTINTACAIAEQAMLAIENIQIRRQAEQTAISTERARLARDLHDSVAQILFSASLVGEVLPRLWEKDPSKGRVQLAELRSLTKSALAEMRSLLYELRPTALLNTPLPETLHHLVDGAAGRASIPINLTAVGNTPLPPEIKVAFYRITQEALNNIVKHANAAEASVTLKRLPDRAELCIIDNGRGFVPEVRGQDRLGLNIIRERTQTIGAILQIESQPGQGTRVYVLWHRPKIEA